MEGEGHKVSFGKATLEEDEFEWGVGIGLGEL